MAKFALTIALPADNAAPVVPHAAAIPALTGIRGMAALWVMAYHFGTNFGELASPLALGSWALSRSGYLAVDLFFLLSGYVLAHSYFHRAAVNPADVARSFLIGRVFRILPLNAAMLLVMALLTLLLPGPYWSSAPLSLSTFLACLALVQSWGFSIATSWNFPAWSLSAEWAAYGLFPLILLIAWRSQRGSRALALFCAALSTLALVMLLFGDGNLDHVWLLGLPRCFLQFAAGVWLWRAIDLGVAAGRNPDSLFLLGAGGLLIAIVVPALELLAPFAFAAIIAACALRSPITEQLFANRGAMFLGTISFSIYLSHAIVISTIRTAAGKAGLAITSAPAAALVIAVTIGMIIGVSTLLWQFVELPAQRFGRSVQRARMPI